MNAKITTAFTAMLLIASALIVCVPYGSQGEGTLDNPSELYSDYSNDNCRILYTDADSYLRAYLGIDWNSFVNPSVTIESWACDDIGDDASGEIVLMASNTVKGKLEYGNGYGVWAQILQPESTGFNGLYTVTLTASKAVDPCFYKFKIDVEDTIASERYSQQYYYVIYMKTVAEKCNVVVKDGNSYVSDMVIERNTPYQVYLETDEGDYDCEHYYFYAEGLPYGVNMKTNGIIEGEAPIRTIISNPTGTATLYAVNMADATEVHTGTLTYSIVPKDSFEYTISTGQTISCFEDGCCAIKNADVLTVTILDTDGNDITVADGFTAAYSADGSTFTPITPAVVDERLTVTLPDTSDYSGIVQLHITKTAFDGRTYESTLHVMLVGPVVHSGLSPALKSY